MLEGEKKKHALTYFLHFFLDTEVHHENTTTIAFHPPNDNNSVTSNYVSQSENFSSRSSVLGPVNISKIVTTSRATSNDESTTKSASVSNIKENTTPESSSKMQDKKTRLSSLLSNSTKPPSQDHIKNVTTQKSTYSVSTSSFFPVEVLSNDTTNTNILQNNILLLKVGASSCVLIVLGIGLSLVGICVCHFLKSRNKGEPIFHTN